MRKRIGYICVISGIILLINPNMEYDLMKIFIANLLHKYWPILLVILGFSLQSKTPKSRKKVKIS